MDQKNNNTLSPTTTTNKKNKRDVSPSPSSASKLSTVSKLSGIVKFTGFKKKKNQDPTKEKPDKKINKKKKKSSGSNNIVIIDDSNISKPDDAKSAFEKPDDGDLTAADNGSLDSRNGTDVVGEAASSESLTTANEEDVIVETRRRTTSSSADNNIATAAPNATSTPAAAAFKSATLERDNVLSQQTGRGDNEKRRYLTLTRDSKKVAAAAHHSKSKFKFFGNKKPYSKPVAIESTSLDMRSVVKVTTNGGNIGETNNDTLQQVSSSAATFDDTELLVEDNEGKLLQGRQNEANNNWSVESTNEKLLHHLISTEVYDSEDSEILQPTEDDDNVRQAPLARQESSLTEAESVEIVVSTRRISENGSLHVIKKKSPGEIRQEILNRSAPKRTSDIVSPTFQANNNLSRQISVQAKNSGPVDNRKELLCKILVIGELGTGKTSIIKRYVHQFFSQHYRATIGVDFALKVLAWDADTTIRLQLWDIAGQERFGNMTRVYYKEAHGAFIVFDVTRLATFEAVNKWKQDLDSKVQLTDGSPVPCVLLANKCDQPKEGIVNNHSKMDEYCKEHKFIDWFETSAKDNINIDQAANGLVTKILQNEEKKSNKEVNNSAGLVSLENEYEEKKKPCAC